MNRKKIRVESNLCFKSDEMEGQMAKEMTEFSVDWRKIIRADHMTDEGFQVLEQSWQQWRLFITGIDIGYQQMAHGVDINDCETIMTQRFLKDIINALQERGMYTPDEDLN